MQAKHSPNTEAIRSRLGELGWTQTELANRLGCSPQSVSNRLRRDTWSLDTAWKWAKALRVDLEEIVTFG